MVKPIFKKNISTKILFRALLFVLAFDISFGLTLYLLDKSEKASSQISIKSPENFRIKITDIKKETKELTKIIGKQKLTLSYFDGKTITPSEFLQINDEKEHTKVNQTTTPPHITGNTAADKQIQKIAKDRGYKLRPEAIESKLVWIDGQRLQTETKDAWLAMKAQAKKEGVYLGLISGYRSVNRQRSLFLGSFGNKYTYTQITSGQADNLIDAILKTRSIPGYSKHHTGYTIDITNNSISDFTNFGSTKGYQWISKNNYENAKKFGFVPSYPEGGQNMGPNPEPWEYVWVATK